MLCVGGKSGENGGLRRAGGGGHRGAALVLTRLISLHVAVIWRERNDSRSTDDCLMKLTRGSNNLAGVLTYTWLLRDHYFIAMKVNAMMSTSICIEP